MKIEVSQLLYNTSMFLIVLVVAFVGAKLIGRLENEEEIKKEVDKEEEK